MHTTGFVLGIIGLILTVLGIFPCFFFFMWMSMPLSVAGLIISIYAYKNSLAENTKTAKNGIILNSVSLIIIVIYYIITFFIFAAIQTLDKRTV